ncbi:hypothetical protein AB0K00_00680 [Dactylosporangium sp. NPDC049525]|uniref:hypothetical protein n=1 Tax=Dactylosporangium sp. NPDC049525 TaxID=3154730 RepID=UPI0034229A79
MNRLTETLDDIAEQAKLYDVTDLAIMGANRRRRTRVFAVTALALLAVTCVLGVAALVRPVNTIGRPEVGPGRQDGDAPALVQPLLDTPTRGSLAGDINFIKDVLDRVLADPDAYGMPDDRARLRVLFAGDLPGNRRLVIVAGSTDRPRMIDLTGRRGAAAKNLELTAWGDVEEPVVRNEWRTDNNAGYSLVFGPEGYDVSVSDRPRYLLDGTVQRQWTPEPAGYIMRDTAKIAGGARVRISRGSTIFYEGRLASPGTQRTGTIDPNPLYGRGKPAPRAAKAAADALAYSTGLVGPDIHYVVLWSDDFVVDDPNGGGSGVGQIATVMAVTPDGGGPYITLATDTNPEPNGRDHPTGSGVFGDPERALIVMRLPHFNAEQPTTVQIVAPPAAVRLDLLRDGTVFKSTPLVNGVGQLGLGLGVELTARAYDAQGAVVAERIFTDDRAASGTEPEVKGW